MRYFVILLVVTSCIVITSCRHHYYKDFYSPYLNDKDDGDHIKEADDNDFDSFVRDNNDIDEATDRRLDDTILLIKELLKIKISVNSVDSNKNDGKYSDEESAKSWLKKYNDEASVMDNVVCNADWDYSTNITDSNAKMKQKVLLEDAKFNTKHQDEARKFHRKDFSNDINRQLMLISRGTTSKNTKLEKEITELATQMSTIYSTSKVCNTTTKCYNLEPDLQDLMAKSRDYYTLQWAWKAWRDVTGPALRKLYPQFVEKMNIAARENEYADIGESWRNVYEVDDLEALVESIWKKVEPMYRQLHAYVRRKLIDKYPGKISPTGYIPAHLLGNMWSQQWANILDLVMPYPEIATPDITPQLKEQNYTALKMFQTAESFFTSIGLSKMTQEFWDKSMITKPEGREVVCHGSAEDFHNASDYRIKMCTETSMEYLYVIHHEMGHVEYYMQYAKQPNIYRNGANPGFHEAVGDTIALSVVTPEHLQKIDLMKTTETSKDIQYKRDINFLMKSALDKVAFLPFGLLIDKWRWDVFSGKTKPTHYNEDWWKLRKHYQGIEPPPDVKRTEDNFDPGAKFHIPDNVPYIRYFFSFVLQFQFHESLCKAKGHEGPIHHCDIYNSKAAGEKLKNMLSLGASKHWSVALEALTGSTEVQTSSINKYFEPLMEWLKIKNKDEHIGWEEQ